MLENTERPHSTDLTLHGSQGVEHGHGFKTLDLGRAQAGTRAQNDSSSSSKQSGQSTRGSSGQGSLAAFLLTWR